MLLRISTLARLVEDGFSSSIGDYARAARWGKDYNTSRQVLVQRNAVTIDRKIMEGSPGPCQ